MISDFNQIKELFKELDSKLNKKVDVFVIGGVMLLYHGLKPATKDIDIIVETKKDFINLENAFISVGFRSKLPSAEYKCMDINQILIRDDFRIDLFCKTVCRGLSLSNNIMKRAEKVLEYDKLIISFCSNEDVFLFKTMTEREGDLEDCIGLAQRGLNWNILLNELKYQVKAVKKPVWITWVGERLDILEDKGLLIPIMPEINKLRDEYIKDFEKQIKEKQKK